MRLFRLSKNNKLYPFLNGGTEDMRLGSDFDSPCRGMDCGETLQERGSSLLQSVVDFAYTLKAASI